MSFAPHLCRLDLPKNVSVQVFNTTSLQLSWLPVTAAGSMLYYRVTCFECRSEVNLTSNTTSYHLNGLTPGTNYTLGIASCSHSACSIVYLTSAITCKYSLVLLKHIGNDVRL